MVEAITSLYIPHINDKTLFLLFWFLVHYFYIDQKLLKLLKIVTGPILIDHPVHQTVANDNITYVFKNHIYAQKMNIRLLL